MKFIEESFVDGVTTVQKVSYKGDIWERRENSKLINWFVYDNESNKIFMYQCWLYNNSWRRYINDCIPPEEIEIPYIEKSYQILINPLKLYTFDVEDGPVNYIGVFIATEVDVKNAIGKTISIGNMVEELAEYMIHELNVSQSTIDDLLEAIGRGNYTISGYNPLEYLEE